MTSVNMMVLTPIFDYLTMWERLVNRPNPGEFNFGTQWMAKKITLKHLSTSMVPGKIYKIDSDVT